MTPQIATFSGRLVNPLELRSDDVDIVDIAHGLACVNRFGGQARRPVSVAQHSVYVSWMCDPEVALQGLLHDASEAYLGDMTKWVKNDPRMAAFREAEANAQDVIYRTFGCDTDVHPQVEAADRLMVRMEAQYSYDPGFVGQWSSWNALPVPLLRRQKKAIDQQLGVHYRGRWYRRMVWTPWSWSQSEDEFMGRFTELSSRKSEAAA